MNSLTQETADQTNDSAVPRFTFSLALCSLLSVLCLSGCDAPPPSFRTNEAFFITQELSGAKLDEPYRGKVKQNLKDIMTALFGTPDDPHVPTIPDVDITNVADVSKLKVAAGAVSSNRFGRPQGLYREHCVHCHGITGDGRGPTASFLNPYPRDFRRGLYKFKSTPRTEPPTHEDLMRTIKNGIPGTAMPSFALLSEDDRDALVHYLRYLSIRGEVERALIGEAVNNLSEGELLVNVSKKEEIKPQTEAVMTFVTDIITKWQNAESLGTPVPPPPEDFESRESVARGRELFFGATANCIKCHGETALGDGVVNDFDDWTKELDPLNPEKLENYLDADAVLPPRAIRPRNLRLNVFRGGRRPIDLYWRIHNGIAGTPMPAASMKPADAPADDPRLSDDDVWHLIAYVRSLPYESLSAPPLQPALQRERQ